LRHDGLVGGATYFDASTNDVRLTIANVRAAADAGARIANHAVVREFIVERGAVRGAEITCALTGRTIRARARCVVNAAGPWGDGIHQLADRKAVVGVRGTRGAHIAVPRLAAGTTGAIAITHPRDGRVMFILPAGEFTIVGTTDTDYFGALDQVRATREDVAYLLEAANHYLPATALSAGDVVAAWAGIRPLVASNAATTAAVSREHAITPGPNGLLSVSGGKLTTYRLMAQQIVDRAERVIGRAHTRTRTADVALVPEGEPELDRSPLALAVAQAVRHEMAMTLSDVIIRRLQLAYELRDHGASLAPSVARLMAPMLGWTAAQERDAVSAYARDVERIFAIE
jgi:glycerol-3-phosphate dehydrogenase